MNNTVTRQVLGKIMITSKGEYNSLKSYEILDAVTYQGSSYLSKKYNNDSLPTNANDWQLLAQKGDTYELSEEDLQKIAEQITSNANSAFNQNVKEKTDGFNSNANSKTEAYNTNATEKLGTYNSNHTAKLKEYNDNATSKLSAYNTNTVTKTTEYNSNHTSKLNAYDTNASNKVDVYNTNADARLEEYNTNADTKINEYDEHSKELNNKIVSTRNELERLKSNVLNTGEDTDTFIHLEDSAMAELQEIKVDGVLQQNTTTGKNLFCMPQSATLNGITFNVNSDGSFNISGTATANATFLVDLSLENSKLKSGNTYTLSTNKELWDIAINVENYSNTTWEKAIFTLKNTLTKVTGAYNITDNTNIVRYSIRVVSGKTVNLSNVKIQFEEGSVPTDYEPYTGGQPSPNPDYPQEIKTITDSLKITSCGKNLLPNLFENSTKDRVTLTVDGDYIIINGTTTNIIYFDPPKKNWMMYYLDGNYTYTSNTYDNIKYSFYADNNIQYINSSTKPTTINFPKRIYKRIRPVISLAANSTYNNVRILLQFEKSSSSTLIESYVESQIQAKLQEGEFIGKFDDTYKDTLRTEYFPEEGQYHLMLDKMVGMGDTSKYFGNVKRISTKQNKYRFTFDINTDKIPILNTESNVIYPLYCNKFIKGSRETTFSEINSISYGTITSSYSQFMLYYSEIKDFTIAQFSEWLTNNPLIIYYILQKPYTLDLGVIDMPMSYKDITNIFTDSDLLPTINAKYYRVFEKTIQNAQINEKTLKQEITDLNATVNALDTRLKALETKTVEEPTESEGTV